MIVSKRDLFPGPKYFDSLPICLSRNVWVYVSYLHALRLPDMLGRDRVSTLLYRLDVLHNTDVRAWFRRWLHCCGRGLPVSRCMGCEIDCPFARVFLEVKYEKHLSTLLRFGGLPLSEYGPSLVVLLRPCVHLYLAYRFDYWARDGDFEFVCIFMPG